MHCFSFIVVTALMLLTIGTQPVSSDQMIRFIFNNGTLPTSTVCTAADNTTIANVFRPRRNLRKTDTNAMIVTSSHHRELLTYPSKCKSACLGYISCHAVNCVGYDGTINRRNLMSCTNILSTMNNELDNLNVSPSCKTFLHKDRRNGECYNDVMNGEVFGARLHIDTPGAVPSYTFTDIFNTSAIIPVICKDKQRISIEAIVNECVDDVEFIVNGPQSYFRKESQGTAPYAIFGNFGSIIDTKYMPYRGVYTFDIRPDGYVEKTNTIKINVTNC